MELPDYAELHCISNFSFLRGASHPYELVQQAVRLGYRALALTDECSLAGVVRAHVAARGTALKLIVGSEFRLSDGFKLVLLATDRAGYGALSKLITYARSRSEKGGYSLMRGDLKVYAPAGCLALWLPNCRSAPEEGAWLETLFPEAVWIGVELLLSGDDAAWLERLRALSRRTQMPLVAAGDVHMHCRSRRMLRDTVTAIRLGRPLSELGYALFSNGERHLRPCSVLARLYPVDLLKETVRIAERVHFSLDELRYEYPDEIVPKGQTPAGWLRMLTEHGARTAFRARSSDCWNTSWR